MTIINSYVIRLSSYLFVYVLFKFRQNEAVILGYRVIV